MSNNINQLIHMCNVSRQLLIDTFVDDITNKVFLEIGYGANFDTGGICMSCLYNQGAARPVFGIDVYPYKQNDILSQNWKENNLLRDSEGHVWNNIAPPIVKLHMNSENMYFKNDMFDVIYSSAVLEHITSPELAFREMFRVLKNGGIAAHSWNPWTSLLMGGHDIGIPYHYPWAHLRLSADDHIKKLQEVISNDELRLRASVKEHTIVNKNLDISDLYYGTTDDLNKITILDMCKLATNAGFTIMSQQVNYYSTLYDVKPYLTTEIRNELVRYSDDELLCSSHTLILKKP